MVGNCWSTARRDLLTSTARQADSGGDGGEWGGISSNRFDKCLCCLSFASPPAVQAARSREQRGLQFPPSPSPLCHLAKGLGETALTPRYATPHLYVYNDRLVKGGASTSNGKRPEQQYTVKSS